MAQGLFREYLTNLRHEKLQQSHAQLVGPSVADSLERARIRAYEAELVGRVREAFDVYEQSPERFLKEFIQ